MQPDTKISQTKKSSRLFCILAKIVVGVVLYLVFSFAFFLGLQINPMLGNIGVLFSVGLLLLYIFTKSKKVTIATRSVSVGLLVVLLGGAIFLIFMLFLKTQGLLTPPEGTGVCDVSYTCSDFYQNYSHAQDIYDVCTKNGSAPNVAALDSNNDGVACSVEER